MVEKDVGLMEDAIFYLKNCIASENHALMSYLTTNNKKWLDALDLIRKNRGKLLNFLVKKENSQVYCFSKHLLAMSIGVSEVANRYLEKGEKEIAKELYGQVGDYESLFLLFNNYVKGGDDGTTNKKS